MTSISFARVAGSSTTLAGTNVYVPPSRPTATGANGQLLGSDISDYYLLHAFTKPYLDAHTLSWPSFRYAYYVWFVLIPLFLIWVAVHQLHFRGGAVGAWFRKPGMRKISFGRHNNRNKQKAKPSTTSATTATAKSPKSTKGWSSPTVAQMLALVIFTVFVFLVSYIGPDYINPFECIFGGGRCGFHPVNGNGATQQFQKREELAHLGRRAFEGMHSFAKRRYTRYGWSALVDPLLAGPNYTIDKNYWISASRVGLIAYALLPLSVSLALKQWPMNIFATPFFTNLHVDKTIFFHKWVGRIVWALSTVHAGLWTKQMFVDLNPFDEPTWYTSWRWHRLLAGGISYVALTILVAFSFKPLRQRYYEFFYYSHVILVLIFLVTIIIHYQALQGWCILAAGLWGLERSVRSAVWLWLNFGKGIPVWREGRIGNAQFRSRGAAESGFKVYNVEKRLSAEAQKYAIVNQPHQQQHTHPYGAGYGDEEWSAASRSTHNLHSAAESARLEQDRQHVYAFGPGNDEARRNGAPAGAAPPYGAGPYSPTMHKSGNGQPAHTPARATRSWQALQAVPRGYALAQILPGRIIKLTLHTPRHINWKPGQHVQLTLPSVRWWQSHPYTIANAQSLTEAMIAKTLARSDIVGSEITLPMSIRRGFTKRLFQSILQKRRRLVSSESHNSSNTAPGVLIRAQTYLPSGSSARAQWDDFPTVVLIAAGTGVTYTLSVLEHICHQMAAKDAALRGEEPTSMGGKKRKFKPTNIARVRFVWVLREYAHLAWIAPALRRCIDISDPSRLRIDLCVTSDTSNLSNKVGSGLDAPRNQYAGDSQADFFKPPQPGFVRGAHRRIGSADSSATDLSQTVVDPNEYYGQDRSMHSYSRSENETPHQQSQEDEDADFSVTDMVLFDGEDERPTFEDEEISRTIKKEGKLRRGLSRKRTRGKQVNASQADSTNGAFLHPQTTPVRSRLREDLPEHSDMSGDETPTWTPARSHQYPPVHEHESRNSSRYAFGQMADDQADKESFLTSGTATPRPNQRWSQGNAPLLNREEEAGTFDMSEADKEDLNVVAELARGGRPDLSGIVDAEIEASQGKIAVGCCGPSSLNDLVRNMVAKRVKPGKVARGDQRGNVELVVEDFNW